MGAPELMVLSLGLSIVVAGLGWAGGRGVERMSADPRLRDRVWAGALVLPALPPLAVGLMLLTPAPVREISLAATTLPAGLVAAPVGNAAAPSQAFALDPTMTAWVVLGIAALLTAVRLAALALRAGRLLRVISQAKAPNPTVAGMVEAAARDLAIRPPRVGVSTSAREALLASLGRARLILPVGLAEAADAEAARAVIAHELAHLKRGDHHAVWMEEALLVALAFNPLMLVLRARRAAAREEACDALALEQAAPDIRRAYARSLIEALRDRAGPHASGGLPALTFTGAGRTTAMLRLKAVLSPAPAAGRGLHLTAFGLAGLIALLGGAGSLAVAGEREAEIRVNTTPPSASNLSAAEQAAPTGRSPAHVPAKASSSTAVSAQSRLTPEQQARYRGISARQYQAICASADPADHGFCGGVMFSVLARASENGVCPPDAVARPDATGAELSSFVDGGRREVAALRTNADEGTYEFAQRALKRAYPCDASGPAESASLVEETALAPGGAHARLATQDQPRITPADAVDVPRFEPIKLSEDGTATIAGPVRRGESEFLAERRAERAATREGWPNERGLRIPGWPQADHPARRAPFANERRAADPQNRGVPRT